MTTHYETIEGLFWHLGRMVLARLTYAVDEYFDGRQATRLIELRELPEN